MKNLIVNRFEPRWYQRELINAIEYDGKKNLVVVWPRRAGKDVAALNIMLRQAFKRVGVYYYLFPKQRQCRENIWDSILITGEKFLDFIPEELIDKKNNVEMKIVLINGSIIKFSGADNADTLRGGNPVGVVFSEYSRVNHPEAYSAVISPILAGNGGWVIFISTPNGHNNFYELYKFAQEDTTGKWYNTLLTVNDTKHMSDEALADEKKKKADETFLQEYHCSFEIANAGVYYAKYLAKAYADERIGFVPHDPGHQVHTAWDLGFRCPSVISFFQVIGRKICVIDHYHKSNEELSHYVNVVQSYSDSKKYIYGSHFVPHDAENHDLTSGKTRLDILRNLGLDPIVLKKTRVKYGIELVRINFNRMFFDKAKCSLLLDALESYSKTWDSINKCYIDKDKRNWTADHADTIRYMCLALDFVDNPERSTEEFNKKRRQLKYGNDIGFSPYFKSR